MEALIEATMERCNFLAAALLAIGLCVTAQAEPIAVKHLQLPMHRFMVARSEDGKIVANVEFWQAVQGEQVNMRLTYRFIDGSVDDETTTYTQHGAFRLLRDHHVQTGPFFPRATDFSVDASTGTLTSREAKNGRVQVESKHIKLPDDLANGIVGTLLLNVPHNTAPFRVGMLTPVAGGRVIRLLISPDSEQKVQLAGQSFEATVFRVHPELGGFLGVLARLLGLQPKDVMVWVLEGDEPAVAVIVGQLGGAGPVVSSDLVGTSLDK